MTSASVYTRCKVLQRSKWEMQVNQLDQDAAFCRRCKDEGNKTFLSLAKIYD